MEPDRSAHWTYWIEFFIMPPLALLLAVFALGHAGMWTLPLFVAGGLIWTLIEYGLHRVALHHWPYFMDQHDVHHKYPKSYIGVNTLVVLTLFGLVGLSLSLIATGGVSAAILSGISAAYGQYILIHHNLHHKPKETFSSYMMMLWNHHAAHHRGGNYNFGVSTTLWDKVFRTLRD